MVSYCSSSADRSLTNRLIETSNCPLKSTSHQFFNTSEWTDGLDCWLSSSQIPRKTSFTRANIDFSPHLGLYLPRQDKSKSAQISMKNEFISSTSLSNHLCPKRLRQLFKKEKDLFNDIPSEQEENPSTHDIPTSNVTANQSTRIRYPLHHIQSSNSHSSRESRTKQHIDESTHQDRLKLLLKQQLNKLFNKETLHLNCKGTVLRTSSLETKRAHKSTRSTSAGNSTSILERYTQFRQVLVSPSMDETSMNSKPLDTRQSPIFFRGLSTLGLTVKPLVFSSPKTLQNSSSESISQHDHRSLTQPVSRCNSTYLNEEQRNGLKRGLLTSHESFSQKISIDDQTQVLRNFHRHHRHHRSATKTAIQRSKLSELLPTVTPEKCFLIPISNHRNT